MKRLKKIYIEITNVCNLQCHFCPKTGRKPEFMSIETFCRALDQIHGYTGHVCFHVKGEPLLHPQLDKLLDICEEMKLRVNITTNGTLIQDVQEMLLTKPALRQMNFSLHSFDGNEGLQNKEEYIRNILTFTRKALLETNLLIALRLWNLDRSRELESEREQNSRLLGAIEEAFGLPYRIQDKIISNRGIQIAQRLYVNEDHRFQWPDMRCDPDDGAGFCYGLRSQAAILSDGTVVPCCLDGDGIINLGNIKTAPFSEIIESPRATEIVDGFTRRIAVEELCKRCGFRKRFG